MSACHLPAAGRVATFALSQSGTGVRPSPSLHPFLLPIPSFPFPIPFRSLLEVGTPPPNCG